MSEPVLRLKDDLDRLSDVLRPYAQLTGALAADRRDRHAHHKAFNAFLDVVRLAATPDAPTREETRRRLLAEPRSEQASVVERFALWQRRGFDPARADAGLVVDANRIAFAALEELGRALAARLVAAPAPRPFELPSRADAPHYDRVAPSAFVPAWDVVAKRLLAAHADVITVWPSYYHLYVVVADGAARAAEELVPVIADVVRGTEYALFTTRARVAPIERCRPLILPASVLGPLLWSCYLNKPFKYFDFRREPTFARPGAAVAATLAEPPDEMLTVMAREAACHAALTLRAEPGRLESRDQVQRAFLRIMQLRLFLERRTLVVPLAATSDVVRQHCPDSAAWVDGLARDGGSPREAYERWFPAVRRTLDGLLRTISAEACR